MDKKWLARQSVQFAAAAFSSEFLHTVQHAEHIQNGCNTLLLNWNMYETVSRIVYVMKCLKRKISCKIIEYFFRRFLVCVTL